MSNKKQVIFVSLLIKVFKIIYMYSYHNRIKQRIDNDELIHYEFVDNYKQIAPCLLLHFKTEPYVRPIREHRFEMYNKIIQDWDSKK